MKTNHYSDKAIVLSRVDYGEQDRVVTLLGAEHGKTSLIAKSARASKSKLASGIELFAVSDIQYVRGKGHIGTLTGARMITSFYKITDNIERSMAGYEFLKLISRTIQSDHGQEYFSVLEEALAGLKNSKINLDTIRTWFGLHVLTQAGQSPELAKNASGQSLKQEEFYNYDFDTNHFYPSKAGQYNPSHIKLLRVLMTSKRAPNIVVDKNIVAQTTKLVEQILKIQLY